MVTLIRVSQIWLDVRDDVRNLAHPFGVMRSGIWAHRLSCRCRSDSSSHWAIFSSFLP